MKHFALIPARKNSSRCPNKNWRNFVKGYSLVDFALNTIPKNLFNTVIVSTDKEDYRAPKGVEKHLRDKKLAQNDSCIEDLIQLLIREYRMSGEDYLWMLIPTAPFRLKDDYYRIAETIEEKTPVAIVSAVKIHPFIWKNTTKLFETKGKRCRTQDFTDYYFVENGMFIVTNVDFFRRNNSWYGETTILHKQDKIWCFVDIDTEDDFAQAQKIAKPFCSLAS